MTETPTPDDRQPEDDRLDELLAEVRSSPVPEAPDLTDRVVRAARWQRGVRGVLMSVTALVTAVAEGIGAMLGVRHHKHGGDE